MSGEGLAGRDDWAQGDLALCVNNNGWASAGVWQDEPGPFAGQILTVIGVRAFAGRTGLRFEEWPTDWFHAVEFRKITPGAHIEGVEAEARHPIPSLMPVPQ